MTPQDLETIERAYDKARNAGPAAVEDWAKQYAVTMFARLRPEIDGSKADTLAPLRPLFPGVADVAQAAADDITALRADRAKRTGGAIPELPVEFADTAALYDSDDGAFWAQQFLLRTKATPALAQDEGFVIGWFANAIETGKRHATPIASDPRLLADALRPFAAFGAPIVIEALDAARASLERPPAYVFAVADSTGAALLAGVTREQCVTAHELINQIDGGAGA